LIGNSANCGLSTVPPCVSPVVSTSGIPARTSTLSRASPGDSVTFAVWTVAAVTRISPTAALRNPALAAVTLYVPSGSSANT
jgi:hypothetical protein